MTINLKDFTLLIVDDDQTWRNTLCDFFAEEGAKVFSARNGEEALQIIQFIKIDIILSDVRMPQMEGTELLKSIRANKNITPLVWFMSGQCELTEESAIDLGAEGLLNKPFKLHYALGQIAQSLERNYQPHSIHSKKAI